MIRNSFQYNDVLGEETGKSLLENDSDNELTQNQANYQVYFYIKNEQLMENIEPEVEKHKDEINISGIDIDKLVGIDAKFNVLLAKQLRMIELEYTTTLQYENRLKREISSDLKGMYEDAFDQNNQFNAFEENGNFSDEDGFEEYSNYNDFIDVDEENQYLRIK